jgi:hypothetical protein
VGAQGPGGARRFCWCCCRLLPAVAGWGCMSCLHCLRCPWCQPEWMPCQQLQPPFCLLLTAAADAAVFPSPLPLTAPPACRAMSNCTLRFEAILLLLIENAVYRTTLRPDADSLETLNAVRTLPQGSTRRKAPWQRSPQPAARHPGNARHTQPLPARHPLSGCAWPSTHRLLARVPQTLPHPIGSRRRAANAQATHA